MHAGVNSCRGLVSHFFIRLASICAPVQQQTSKRAKGGRARFMTECPTNKFITTSPSIFRRCPQSSMAELGLHFHTSQGIGRSIDSWFPLCSPHQMDELPFKIVRMHGPRDEVIARIENLLICTAAFEKALFVYPDAHLECAKGRGSF
jgi:hypothetical protein